MYTVNRYQKKSLYDQEKQINLLLSMFFGIEEKKTELDVPCTKGSLCLSF